MAISEMLDFSGGINWRLPRWHKNMAERKQCYLMQNLRCSDDNIVSIPGTRKHHGTTMGATSKVSAIMQYYNDQTNDFKLLVACGGSIYRRDEQTNEMVELLGGLNPDSIFGADQRYETLYIPSVKDGLKKYMGGTAIENVGGGDTAPGNFRQVLYMKEIDRLFGISDDAVYGQMTWCDIGEPEIWDGANVQRFKLKKGERVEAGAILYGKLIIFCTYSIWIYFVQGNEENWRLEEAPTTVGCVAPNTVKRVGREIWFLGESPEGSLGVYAFNGTSSKLLTDDISPFFEDVNRNKLRNACAETHDELYMLSIATGFSQTNNKVIELDLINYKSDGTPAIYGPHTYGFYSSAVLNGRQNNKELLLGGEDDGFVYIQNGTTFKSTNGDDGELIPQRFVSRIDNAGHFDTMKRYDLMNIFFRPSGFFNAKLNVYISYADQAHNLIFNPTASYVGFAGEFDVFNKTLQGTPSLYTFQEFLGMSFCVGTSIAFEIINETLNGQISFDGISYEFEEVYQTRRSQSYVD